MQETPEEKEVREIVKEAENQLKDLFIATRQGSKGLQPSPGGPVRFMGDSHYRQADREAEKAHQEKAIRQNVLNRTANAIKHAPVAVQVKAYKIADNFAYPETADKTDPSRQPKEQKDIDQAQRSAMRLAGKDNLDKKEPTKDIDEAQRSAQAQRGNTPMKERESTEKDISESQDYAMRRLNDEKEKNATDEPAAKKKDETKGFTATFSGAKYYQQVKEVTHTNNSPSPKKDKGVDLDR